MNLTNRLYNRAGGFGTAGFVRIGWSARVAVEVAEDAGWTRY